VSLFYKIQGKNQ